MPEETVQRRVLSLFADILEYPRPGLPAAMRECEALVSPTSPEAAMLLHGFRAFVEETPPGRLEEIYTGTFDLDAACYPYVGYHLFGESYKRSLFMQQLKERYQAQGFMVEHELPDHLAVLLRFLATGDDPDLVHIIIQEALLPALEQMIKGEETESASEADKRPDRRKDRNLYRQVLEALRLVLQRQPQLVEAMS